MGWFSLGGDSNMNPPMCVTAACKTVFTRAPVTVMLLLYSCCRGIYDLLMDPSYDDEVGYLRKLSAAKQAGADYFNFGRAMR